MFGRDKSTGKANRRTKESLASVRPILFERLEPRILLSVQEIMPVPIEQTVLPGDPASITVTYATSDPVDQTLTGLGLRIHYDSSALTWDSFSDVFATGKIGEDSSPNDDTSDFDGDPSTDKFLTVAWADLMGNWPGENMTLPLDLYVANFTSSPSFSGSTSINFSASSTPAGHSFYSESAIVNAQSNQPATVSLANTTVSLPEDTDTSSRIKVADIVVSDDGLGTNTLSLSGADAALFEIDGAVLYLMAGVSLDHETNPVLDVTVAVDDPSVGSTPDDTASLSIAITDVPELTVERWRIRLGRKPGTDIINISGRFSVPSNSILGADEIEVRILASDGSEVYSELISVNLADFRRGIYTYRPHKRKGWPGGIILLKLDTNKQQFVIKAKDIDLSGLDESLNLKISVGDYLGSTQ